MKRKCFIYKRSDDGKRAICIDILNKDTILDFLNKDPTRIKKFKYAIDIILRNLKVSELYGKENIDEDTKDVTAIKLFKGGQNIRIYCKEKRDNNSIFYIIVAELLEKKKDQKVKGKTKTLIQTVSEYEYEIVENEEVPKQLE